jgi:predicted metalloprotease
MTRSVRSIARALAAAAAVAAALATRQAAPPSFETQVQFAEAQLSRYWTQQMANYRAPSEVLPYTPGPSAPCHMNVPDNAYFCVGTRGIYYDARFLRRFMEEVGPFVPVFILAHEWGHHIQHLLGFDDGEAGLWQIHQELQADCLAGAFTGYLLREELVTKAAADDAVRSLFRIGDLRAWFDPQAHGRPGQRIDAFNEGFEGRTCTADEFFEAIGVSVSTSEQSRAPTEGSLGDRVPEQAGRFRRVYVRRLPALVGFGAIEMIQAIYVASDGVRVTLTLAAFADRDGSAAALDRIARTSMRRGLKEVRRSPVIVKGGRDELGTIIHMQWPTELVLWTNLHVMAAVEGPRDQAWEFATRVL